MMNILKTILTDWNSEKNQRTKLQQLYVVLTFVLAVVAGLVSLLNTEAGRWLIMLAALFAGVYVINAIVWALTDAFLIRKIDSMNRQRTSKK